MDAHRLFAATGILYLNEDESATLLDVKASLNLRVNANLTRAWTIVAHRRGLTTVGEIEGADILYASREIKAIAEHWFPPMHT